MLLNDADTLMVEGDNDKRAKHDDEEVHLPEATRKRERCSASPQCYFRHGKKYPPFHRPNKRRCEAYPLRSKITEEIQPQHQSSDSPREPWSTSTSYKPLPAPSQIKHEQIERDGFSEYHEESFEPVDSSYATYYPYYSNVYGHWQCKYCSSLPNKAPGSIWQSSAPPPETFMDEHLSECQGYHSGAYQDTNVSHGKTSATLTSRQDSIVHQQAFRTKHKSSSPPNSSYSMPPLTGSSHPHMHHTYHDDPHDTYSQHYYMHDRGVYYEEHPQNIARSTKELRLTYKPDYDPAAPEVPSKPASKELVSTHQVPKAEENPSEQKMCDLVLPKEKKLLTDFFYHVMMQLRPCTFTEEDRKTRGGKRWHIKKSYPGLQCKHCAGERNSRKFFWASADRLSNSFAEIPTHIMKCQYCPKETKDALMKLKKINNDQISQLPRGGQKFYLRSMWARLHSEKVTGTDTKCKGVKKDNDDSLSDTMSTTTKEGGFPDDVDSTNSYPFVSQTTSDDIDSPSSPVTTSTNDAAEALVKVSRNHSVISDIDDNEVAEVAV